MRSRSPLRLALPLLGTLLVSLALGCAASPASFSVDAPAVVPDERDTSALVAQVLAGPTDASVTAALRARGPGAVDALRAALERAPTKDAARVRSVIDEVAQQRDADISGLYWYTDLEAAQRAARQLGRPILSLRMLGKLNEDLSCANSRFFRTALYANERVSRALRERFVLHWSSEREVPLVTIDFRDGRKIQRTITGNSIHYVLDAEGRPLDAIPGLYGPDAFLSLLGDAEALANRTWEAPRGDFERIVRSHHEARALGLDQRWRVESTQLGFGRLAPPVPVSAPAGKPPPAALAMPIAAPKAMVEMPMLQATQRFVPATGAVADDTTPEAVFAALANSQAATSKLDARSRMLIRRKNPMSWVGASGPAPLDDAQLERMVVSFEKLMALDTVKNEYRLHARIHAWLAQSPTDLESLNARVYDELFLTPANDKWLGLVPPEAFTGLDNDGVLPR